MTKVTASARSGSSARTSDVPPLDAVIELGNLIVESFKREGDRLSEWMAHRLAELMDAAVRSRTRADREAAAQQAADLILRLWRHRHEWPRGWPPGELGTLLERLHEIETTPAWRGRRRSSHDPQPGWASALTELDMLAAAEKQIATSASLASIREELEAWLQGSSAAGDTDEVLVQLRSNTETARRRLSGRADPRLASDEEGQGELDLVALQQNALSELVALASRRAELFKSIAEAKGLSIPRAPRKRAVSASPRPVS